MASLHLASAPAPTQVAAVLWTDGSEESKAAMKILADQHVKFVEVNNPPGAKGRRVPQLFTPLGDFPGLDLIRWYAAKYGTRNGR
jgi:hypothetical protein